MGVDAVMFAVVERKLSDKEIQKFAVLLSNAFFHTPFFIQHKKDKHHSKSYSEESQHAVSCATDDDLDAYGAKLNTKKGSTLLRFNLWSRYYGPGYERGDWAQLSSIILFTQMYFGKAVKLFYGGDSGEGMDEVTDDFMRDMWAHFTKHAHFPYQQSGWFSRPEEEKEVPYCDLCNLSYTQNGSGATYIGTFCAGCGHKLNSTDNGKTWHEPKEGDPFFIK
jgi:hypothetical protein